MPLGMPGKKMSGRQILESHPKGMAYAELLADHKRYPVLVDSKGQVLSMPPIINSDETKLKKGTTRVFIDVTGISQAAVTKSLDTLVCSLAEIGGDDRNGRDRRRGRQASARRPISSRGPRKSISPKPSAGSVCRSTRNRSPTRCGRCDSTLSSGTKEKGSKLPAPLLVLYPAYRTDIRHMVDLFEDVAIGYGYANIEPRLVRSMTVGTPRPEETLSDRVRQILIGLGFSEIMSLPLTTEEHQFERLRVPTPDRYPQVSNPKLKAYNVVRGHLMGGLFEALRENRRRPMPLRMFEIDNVVDLDDVGRNRRGRISQSRVRRNWPRERLRHGPQRRRCAAPRARLESRVRGDQASDVRRRPCRRILRRRQTDRRARRSPPRSAHELRPHVPGRAGRNHAAARLLTAAGLSHAEAQSAEARSIDLCALCASA